MNTGLLIQELLQSWSHIVWVVYLASLSLFQAPRLWGKKLMWSGRGKKSRENSRFFSTSAPLYSPLSRSLEQATRLSVSFRLWNIKPLEDFLTVSPSIKLTNRSGLIGSPVSGPEPSGSLSSVDRREYNGLTTFWLTCRITIRMEPEVKILGKRIRFLLQNLALFDYVKVKTILGAFF